MVHGGDDRSRTDIYAVQTRRPAVERHPHGGARRQNRTDVTEAAALRLATRQAVPELLERVVGLEPTSSRRQRDVLATGRYPHGVRGRTRTPGINVRSVEPHPRDANTFPITGAGDGTRTRILSLEGSCAAFTPRPLSSRVLHHHARGLHELWRPWQESNPQTFRFGGGVSTIASRPVFDSFRGDRWDSNPLIRGSQPRAHPVEPRPHRNDRRNSGAPRRRRADLRSLQGSARCASVQGLQPWSHRRESNALFRITNAAFSQQNFDGSHHWRGRSGSNRHVLAYETSALPLVLRPRTLTAGGPNRI